MAVRACKVNPMAAEEAETGEATEGEASDGARDGDGEASDRSRASMRKLPKAEKFSESKG
jgi:hypothetical protein